MNALLKYHQKQLDSGKRKRTSKKNKKPEFEVVKSCMKWLRDNGFSVDIVEAKAVYSRSAGMYLNGQTTAGMTDCVGCTPIGTACFIEFKAKDRICTLKEHQREFIRQKILLGAFSTCVDSVERLSNVYMKWQMLGEREQKIAFLLSLLPKQKSLEEFSLD